ncbi:MAG: molybdate ABC transporter substrate-binding protein [Desulfobulbaceae bacterium DB1]|nr:MAG: molybdate ABC transporter substrate-binding protein [Desulfobulbaceae bacterium DB1]
MKVKLIVLFYLIQLCLTSTLAAHAEDVRLSVAASMKDAMTELAAAFEQANPHVSIVAGFGSSGSQAKQISQGAPADLFISANPKWMDFLEQEDKIAPESMRFCASNTLVLVGLRSTPISSLAELTGLQRIAIGSPKSVPAGQYAEQAMRAAGVYEKLAATGKLVMTKDVRQALLYADRGEVDAAFVYRTDALLVKNSSILYTVPSAMHDRISYLLTLTKEGQGKASARNFHAFLATPAAVDILKKYGFEADNDIDKKNE